MVPLLWHRRFTRRRRRFNAGTMKLAWLLLLVACGGGAAPASDWRVTGSDPGNSRYSALEQIDTGNVSRLQVAWIFHTGDLPADHHGEIQATPIVVDGRLFTTTPALAVVALHADRGTLIWRFDPHLDDRHVNRGVVYWGKGRSARIFFTAGRRIYPLAAPGGRATSATGTSSRRVPGSSTRMC